MTSRKFWDVKIAWVTYAHTERGNLVTAGMHIGVDDAAGAIEAIETCARRRQAPEPANWVSVYADLLGGEND